MRIVFVCSSLEPGRDGVGDYTRRLAGELIRQGHSCRMIALHDGHLSEADVSETAQQSEETPIECLRMPSRLPWQTRMELAKNFVDYFDPDWVSLQFVLYSFHLKGMPVWLGRRLKRLCPTAKWHIMFHELWIGMEAQSSFIHRVVGNLQRGIIRDLVLHLRPGCVHTQCGLYLQQLRKVGVRGLHLPLFGNIPIRDRSGDQGKDSNWPKRLRSEKNELIFIHFGHIRPNVPLGDFAAEISYHMTEGRKPAVFLAVGRTAYTESYKQIFAAVGVRFESMGELPPEAVSDLLLEADVGVITTPAVLAEKSGAMAAMREHGLPIISVAQPWDAIGIPHPPELDYVLRYETNKFVDNLHKIHKSDPIFDAPRIVARQFVKDLCEKGSTSSL